MAAWTQALEGAAVVGGLALELGGHAAKALYAQVLKFAADPGASAENLINRGAETLSKTKDWVSTHPLAIGGAAFGVGALCVAHCRCRSGRKKK
ncbi:MAG: hypothetical protein LBS10_11155 [Gracilibacteraceae bacterium]|jgi:hypothetical protein|nr:hypothetical protein [Gracilibacteraceae bacterium]